MPKDPTRSEAIYASDLLGIYGLNADKLDGISSECFLRSDVTSFPLTDDSIDLGSTTRRFHRIFTRELWGIESLNGNDFSLFMKRDKHNIPVIASNGTSGYDLGAVNFPWRNIYGHYGVFNEITVTSLKMPNGNKFSHKELSDIGTHTHQQIDTHINTHQVTNTTNGVHGATWENKKNTIVARDSDGNFWANHIYATAHRAWYADLAEKYTSDVNAPVGTLYNVSRDEGHDVEVTMKAYCCNVVGVVSQNPAYVMNDDIVVPEDKVSVTLALKGRVPMLVKGPVEKGDILVSGGDGYAIVDNMLIQYKIAIANESNNSYEVKLVECIL